MTQLLKQIKKDREISEPFDKSSISMELKRHMIITVPSTTGQKHITGQQLNDRARNVATEMTQRFGGSTRIRGQGQYENKRYNKLDDEDVVQVEVFMTPKQWKENRKSMEKYLHNKKKAWKQEDLAVEYDKSETMYFVK